MKNPSEIMQLLCDLARERQSLPEASPLLAVFDLDSTLFEVSSRTQAIIDEFAIHPETIHKYPNEAELLAKVTSHPTDWGIRPTLERSQIRSTWDFFEAIRIFWVERFFSNHYLHLDRLYDGALEFVQSLHEAGATIKYLTGRDQERMGEGTLRVLRQWNFPVENPDTHLILKPHRSMEDSQYKVDQLKNLAEHFDEIWFFENEPVIIHQVISQLPQVKVIFVDTIHSGKAEAPENLPKINARFR